MCYIEATLEIYNAHFKDSKKFCCKQISLNQYFSSFNVLFISFFFGLTSFIQHPTFHGSIQKDSFAHRKKSISYNPVFIIFYNMAPIYPFSTYSLNKFFIIDKLVSLSSPISLNFALRDGTCFLLWLNLFFTPQPFQTLYIHQEIPHDFKLDDFKWML